MLTYIKGTYSGTPKCPLYTDLIVFLINEDTIQPRATSSSPQHINIPVHQII